MSFKNNDLFNRYNRKSNDLFIGLEAEIFLYKIHMIKTVAWML